MKYKNAVARCPLFSTDRSSFVVVVNMTQQTAKILDKTGRKAQTPTGSRLSPVYIRSAAFILGFALDAAFLFASAASFLAACF